jgi:serine phosphatase RsbU (regulator of sigma subunit)/CHASE2 domain-containing sensor protein
MTRGFSRSGWLHTAIAGALATAAALALYAGAPSMLTRLDLRIYDMLLPLRAAKTPSPVPVIVDIDEKSLEIYGQWPWPRYLAADLVEALNRYGVASMAFDVMFAEGDKTSPVEMKNYLSRDKGFDIDFSGLPEEFLNYDKLLADALEVSPAVLAIFADDAAPMKSGELPEGVRVHEQKSSDARPYANFLYAFEGAILPLPELGSRAAAGIINVVPDDDGIIRQIPLVMTIRGRVYPSLALRALMTALGTKNLIIGHGWNGIEFIKVSPYVIPTTPGGMMRIPFIGGRGTYDYVSASDVIRGTVSRDLLAGRVAFVGSSSAGLTDIHPTPLDPVYPGVETHAAALDVMLSGNTIIIPAATPAIQFSLILSAGILATAVFGFARPRAYIPAAIAMILAAAAASRSFFARGVFISPLYAVLTVIILGVAIIFLRLWQEERKKLQMAAKLAEEREKRARTQAELDTARNIQESALPRVFPPFADFPDLEVFAVMKAARDVGGDFYDCFRVDENRLAVVMADVSGKGVSAALFMMIARTLIKERAIAGDAPGGLLGAVNNLLCMDNEASMFVTAFVGIYDNRSGVLTYANAGHTAPLLMRGRRSEWLVMDKNFVLGGMEDINFSQQEMEFRERDCLILYTDGVTEAMNERRELFGDKRLLDLAAKLSHAPRPARSAVEAINEAVRAFAGGAEQSDDITVLAINRLAAGN